MNEREQKIKKNNQSKVQEERSSILMIRRIMDLDQNSVEKVPDSKRKKKG